MQFICFGSGSSGNCYYLFTPTSGILIDAGVGIRVLKKHFRDRGLPMNHIKHILITHDHADHIKSAGVLSEELEAPVYATVKVHDGIVQNFVVRKKVADSRKIYIDKNKQIRLDDFVITPFSVPHDSQDCVGFKVECDGCVFCLMTDVGYVTDDMKAFINEANYLVIESNHDKDMLRMGPYPEYLKARIASQLGHLDNQLSAQTVAENASERLKHVWLCHLSEENNHPELARKTWETVLRNYGIIADKDFRVDILKRKTPSITYDLI